jgi:hypothetical protein
MSAWVCSPKHIAVLAQRLLQRVSGEPIVYTDKVLTVPEFAEQLVDLNLRSVGYLYDMTPAKACREFTGKSRNAFVVETVALAESPELWKEEFSEPVLWGVASCYLYQSCEGKEQEQSITYRIVEQYEKVLRASCERRGEEREGWGL